MKLAPLVLWFQLWALRPKQSPRSNVSELWYGTMDMCLCVCLYFPLILLADYPALDVCRYISYDDINSFVDFIFFLLHHEKWASLQWKSKKPIKKKLSAGRRMFGATFIIALYFVANVLGIYIYMHFEWRR